MDFHLFSQPQRNPPELSSLAVMATSPSFSPPFFTSNFLFSPFSCVRTHAGKRRRPHDTGGGTAAANQSWSRCVKIIPPEGPNASAYFPTKLFSFFASSQKKTRKKSRKKQKELWLEGGGKGWNNCSRVAIRTPCLNVIKGISPRTP